MATSGITTNQLTRNQFIEAALRKLGVIEEGASPSAQNYTDGTIAFNALIGEFRTLGMPVWARYTYSLSLTNGTSNYNIGSGQSVNTPYPVRMLQVLRVDSTTDTQVPVDIISHFDFTRLPTNGSGVPVQVTYQPKINVGVLKVWPTPDSYAASNVTLSLVYTRPLEYMSASTDTLDFPEEWVNAIIYNLAYRLAPEWSIPLPDRQALKQDAKDALDFVLENAIENASLFFQPARV